MRRFIFIDSYIFERRFLFPDFCCHCNLPHLELKQYELDDLKEKFGKEDVVCISYNDSLNEKSKRVRSAVWKNFSRLFDIVSNLLVLNFVMCNGCKAYLQFNGKTTTGLLSHEKKCPAIQSKNANGPPKIEFKSADLVPLRDAAAKFVCMDFRPAFGTEGKGLTEYLFAAIQLSKLYPQMTKSDLMRAMPSRNTVTTHIQKFATAAIGTVSELLRTAIIQYGSFGVTSDLWTEKFNSTSFITITIHLMVLLPTGIQLKSFVMELCEIACDKLSGANIRQAIVDIFTPYGISEDELLLYAHFVTDRGSNMLSAVRDFQSHSCLAHLCNNVVGELMKLPEYKNIVTNASKLVTHVKKTHIASDLITKLKSHCETRWNTVYDMLYSIVINYQDLYHLLETKQEFSQKPVLDKLTRLPLNDMKDIVQFLAFFKNITTATEGDKELTLHKYWPTLLELKKVLKANVRDSDIVRAMKKCGRDYMSQSEDGGSFLPTFRHKMAVFLHPKMKSLSFASPEDRNEVHSHAKNLIDLNGHNATTDDIAQESSNIEQPTSLFQDYFDESNGGCIEDSTNELERYIAHKIEAVKINLCA